MSLPSPGLWQWLWLKALLLPLLLVLLVQRRRQQLQTAERLRPQAIRWHARHWLAKSHCRLRLLPQVR